MSVEQEDGSKKQEKTRSSKTRKFVIVFFASLAVCLILTNIILGLIFREVDEIADQALSENDLSGLESLAGPDLRAQQIGFWLPQLDTEGYSASVSGSEDMTYQFGDDNIVSLLSPDSEEVLRSSYGISNEDQGEEIDIDGYQAKKLSGTSEKDGAETKIILLTVEDKLYLIRGTEEFLTTVEDQMVLP